MENMRIDDSIFHEAVSAIDNGETGRLSKLLHSNPWLVSERLELPGAWLRDKVGTALDGYFKHPYLLWFTANNPIRMDHMPSNIETSTKIIITSLQQYSVESTQDQLTYTLGLVATGRIPHECGVQTQLMDLLIDAGAKPGGGIGALAHGNLAAAEHLISRGGKLTLAVAVCLERLDDVKRLANQATAEELQVALTAAAFYGKATMLSLLIGMGADINAFPGNNSGFHSHATALHQAVFSGSPESVKALTEAGANLNIRDKIYDGTPLDWAEHMQTNPGSENPKKDFTEIIDYLRQKNVP